MTPYLVLLAVVTAIAYLGRKSGNPFMEKAGLLLVVAILICFAGFRDYHIGTDTGNYVYSFHRSFSLKEAYEIKMEKGYTTFVWLTRQLSDNYAALLLSIATIVILLQMSTILRYVPRYEFGIYLYIVLGEYTAFFNAARQSIAVAICFFALRFVLDRRLLPYVVCIGIAMLFHKTAIVALPIYFLATTRIRWRRMAGLALAVAVSVVFIRLFVGLASELLDDRFANYASQGRGGGYVITVYLVVQAIVFVWLRGRIRDGQEIYTRLVNIYLIALVPALVTVFGGVDPSGLLRLSAYFGRVEILIWPLIFREISRTRQYGLLGIGFFALTMIYFILTTMAFSDLTPYRLNTGLF